MNKKDYIKNYKNNSIYFHSVYYVNCVILWLHNVNLLYNNENSMTQVKK